MARAPRSLTGGVVAITGAGRGIGRATAAALLAQGARVAIGDIDAPLAQQAAAELGQSAVGLPLDVTDRASFDGFLAEAERRLGPLDALVNNAGIMPIGPFLHETDATAARIVEINVNGVILGSKLALERFLPRGRGHLVNVASVAGKIGFPGGATYSASKHAVVGLSEALRAELRGSGVDVSIVMPVVVNTELGSGLQRSRGIRVVEPDDVAAAIVDALRSGRVDVYVPRSVQYLFRSAPILPRPVSEFVVRLLKGDRVLVDPDHGRRAAYERRTSDAAAVGAGEAPVAPSAAGEAPVAPSAAGEAPVAPSAAGEAPQPAVDAERASA